MPASSFVQRSLRFGPALVALVIILVFTPSIRGGTKRAFLVAVKTYENTAELGDLPFSLKNVEEIGKLLIRQGYHPDNIVRVADDAAVQPIDAGTILRTLDKFLDHVASDDELFVLFSGHGMRYLAEGNANVEHKDDYYFCPRRANPRVPATMISVERQLQGKIANKGQRRILLVDACRNPPNQLPVRRTERETGPLKAIGTGTIVITSCGSGQVSSYNEKGSFFLQAVARALNGFADKPNREGVFDRRIDASEFTSYVCEETKKLSSNSQSPVPDTTARALESWIICQKANHRVITKEYLANDVNRVFFRDNKELTYVEFQDVDLTRYPSIRNVNFYKSRFVGQCNLRNVHFDACRFVDVDFGDKVDLTGADFRDAVGTEHATVSGAAKQNGTQWNSGKEPKVSK